MSPQGVTAKTRRVVVERDRNICGWCGRFCAQGDLQHRRTRAMGGSKKPDTNQPGNLVFLHHDCHMHIEANRAEAIRRGFNVPQHLTPAEVPLLVQSGPAGYWIRIDDDGHSEQIPVGDAVEYMVLVGLHNIGMSE